MKAYIFVETGEVRAPRGGDYYALYGRVDRAFNDCVLNECPILRRIDVEVPTKAEVPRTVVAPKEFAAGVRWLATKLGLTLEEK